MLWDVHELPSRPRRSFRGLVLDARTIGGLRNFVRSTVRGEAEPNDTLTRPAGPCFFSFFLGSCAVRMRDTTVVPSKVSKAEGPRTGPDRSSDGVEIGSDPVFAIRRCIHMARPRGFGAASRGSLSLFDPSESSQETSSAAYWRSRRGRPYRSVKRRDPAIVYIGTSSMHARVGIDTSALLLIVGLVLRALDWIDLLFPSVTFDPVSTLPLSPLVFFSFDFILNDQVILH
jgi:hypothetical protein